MRHKSFAVLSAIAALSVCCLLPATASAQLFSRVTGSGFASPSPCSSQPVVASGLRAPTKLIFTQHGNLLVAEAGSGPNTGRLSLGDPVSGQRRTLLDGLPSGFTGSNSPPSGPSSLALRGRTLYLTIGAGDSTLPGAATSTRVANPNPSSPLFSSVLAIDFTPRVEQTTTGFTFTYADHEALRSGAELSLSDGGGDQIKLRLVADFPDYTPEPRAGEKQNVRPSDPFGLVIAANHLYIVDSDSSAIRVVDIQSGDASTLTAFAPLASGASEVEAIPASIRFFGDQLLVSLLTGPPFPTAAAQVRIVDPATGSSAPFITGLTAATDVLPVRGRGRTSEFLTLELSADMQAGEPGRLRRYASAEAAPVVVADCLNMPTSMARDERTGDVFITELFTGQIIRVAAP